MGSSTDAPLRRVYLDNAATSWPKSPAAISASEQFIRECGATSGRGAYRSALLADRWLADARHHVAQLLHATENQCIALCNSGTHALNAALWGLLRAGDHVVTSAIEHNSLLRPLKYLEMNHGIRLSIVPCDAGGFVDPVEAATVIDKDTRWIAIGHASNVTGRVQRLDPWRDLARRANAKLLVDASQTLGYIPIDVQASGIDVLAAAGHKGLRALAGTGVLMVSRELQSQLRPLMFGGTGLASEQLSEGQSWPQSVEVGNLNLPGIVSLAVAAAEFHSPPELATGHTSHGDVSSRFDTLWQRPFRHLISGLRDIPAIRLAGWDQPDNPWRDKDIANDNPDYSIDHPRDRPTNDTVFERIPVVSLQVAGWDVHDLANVLDSTFGIEVRAGWHCAALVHAALGTAAGGGTLRLSPGVSTSIEDIDWTLAAFQEILG